MSLPVVTAENYYSPEMNMAYMGSTQFKAFEKCEAAALAELKGEYHPPSSTALLVGGYIDAWFSGELPLYQAQHPEIFKRDGTLKAEYLRATEVVVRMQSDELYMLLMSGKKQVIRTGEIAGVPFKIKIDSLLDGDTCKAIVQRFPIQITLLREKDHQIWTESLLAIVLILRWRKVTSCLPSRIAPRPCGRHTGKRIHLRKSGVKKWKP